MNLKLHPHLCCTFLWKRAKKSAVIKCTAMTQPHDSCPTVATMMIVLVHHASASIQLICVLIEVRKQQCCSIRCKNLFDVKYWCGELSSPCPHTVAEPPMLAQHHCAMKSRPTGWSEVTQVGIENMHFEVVSGWSEMLQSRDCKETGSCVSACTKNLFSNHLLSRVNNFSSHPAYVMFNRSLIMKIQLKIHPKGCTCFSQNIWSLFSFYFCITGRWLLPMVKLNAVFKIDNFCPKSLWFQTHQDCRWSHFGGEAGMQLSSMWLGGLIVGWQANIFLL